MNKNKRFGKYVIAKSFYSHLAIYVILTLFIFLALGFAISAFCYFAGLPNADFPLDACDTTSENFNIIYCLVIKGKDSSFYDLLYYFFIILIILSILALIILNVVYIVNRFFFVRLVKEKSYGAVIYKIEDGKIYYLLLKMKFGHISLCKGHQENGESGKETALREIKEETSLDVEIDTKFVAKITYSPSELTIKDVYFFVAKPINNLEVIEDKHDDEVVSFEWCDYKDALYKITYDSDRNVLKKANNYIRRYKIDKKNGAG